MKQFALRAACGLTIAVVMGVTSIPALAAPDEIVVFNDEFEKKGEVGYELHLNYAARAQDAGLSG